MKKIMVLFLICIVFCVGCAKKMQVQPVEQADVYVYISDNHVYGNQTISGEKYFYFTPCNIARQQKTIMLLEEEIAHILKERGYRQVLDKDKADVIFTFSVETKRKSLTKAGRPIVTGGTPSDPAAVLVELVICGGQLLNKGLSYIKYNADYLNVDVDRKDMNKTFSYTKQVCRDKKKFVKKYAKSIFVDF